MSGILRGSGEYITGYIQEHINNTEKVDYSYDELMDMFAGQENDEYVVEDYLPRCVFQKSIYVDKIVMVCIEDHNESIVYCYTNYTKVQPIPTETPVHSPTKIPTVIPTEIPVHSPTKIPTESPTQVYTEPVITTGGLVGIILGSVFGGSLLTAGIILFVIWIIRKCFYVQNPHYVPQQ